MKLRTVFFFLVFGCWTFSCLGQITFERSYDYGLAEAAHTVIQTTDGGYLMAGRQGIDFFYSEGLLVKTNEYGDVEWHNQFWAGCDTYIWDVKELSDGGYILTGEHCEEAMAGNIFLARTDEWGDTLWLRTFGTEISDDVRSVLVTDNDEFVIVGRLDTAACLIKVEGNGTTIWEKKFTVPYGYNTIFRSGIGASQGGYVACGSTYPDSFGRTDILVIRADENADTVWTKRIGGTHTDIGMAIAEATDGHFYAAGYTWSYGAGNYDMYVVKLTSNGDTVWTRTIGDERENSVDAMVVLADNSVVLLGTTLVQSAINMGSNVSYQVSLARMSADGELLWWKTYGGNDPSNINSDYGYGITKTSDGGFAACGLTNSFGTLANFYLIKTNELGEIIGIDEPINDSGSFSFYPNPATDLIHVVVDPLLSKETSTMVITDMQGRVVLKKENPKGMTTSQINISQLTRGTYHLSILSQNHIQNSTLIVM